MFLASTTTTHTRTCTRTLTHTHTHTHTVLYCTSSASGKLSLHFAHIALPDFLEIFVVSPFKQHFAESQSCVGRSCPYEFGFFPRRSCLVSSDRRQVRHVFVISDCSSQRFSGSGIQLSRPDRFFLVSLWVDLRCTLRRLPVSVYFLPSLRLWTGSH